jgi:hypothetical protein
MPSPGDAPLATAFIAFAAFGSRREASPPPPGSKAALGAARLDGGSFAKLVRDAGLVGRGKACPSSPSSPARLTPAAVDLAFKAAAAGSGGDGRRLGWAGFLAALETLAGKMVRVES